MFSHVNVGTGDLKRAVAFYSQVLAQLDLRLVQSDLSEGWAAWAGDLNRPQFVVGTPLDDVTHVPGNGQMIAFQASKPEAVDAAHAAALALGATCEGAPGPRPHYHPNFYGAYFRDPDGNKICICCHGGTG